MSLFFTQPNLAAKEPLPQNVEKAVRELYHSLPANSKFDMSARLNQISAFFLGNPYILFSLGEGNNDLYDQMPLYRLDGFDCETYVTTVLALALAQSPRGYQQCLHKLRYQNGVIHFITRNHFTGLDWNTSNQQQGFVKDITATIHDENNHSVAVMATALIDKPSWYQHLPLSRIRLKSNNPEQQQNRLRELQRAGSQLAKSNESILYIPLTVLFDEHGVANKAIFGQIPDAAIIQIIRPDWNLKKVIGTNLNVSHLGFVFWKNGQLYFREASSEYNKVVDVLLVEYLSKALDSPTIKGINVQIVLPKKPLDEDCVVR